jgi:hypothetical protein
MHEAQRPDFGPKDATPGGKRISPLTLHYNSSMQVTGRWTASAMGATF